jgi:hypothetical protein
MVVLLLLAGLCAGAGVLAPAQPATPSLLAQAEAVHHGHRRGGGADREEQVGHGRLPRSALPSAGRFC